MKVRKCGTYAGYKAHARRGEPACEPCREARNEYNRQWKAEHPDERPRSGGGRTRRWSDEEIGFLEAHPDMTAYDAGVVLNRSEPSVWAIRKKMREGAIVLAPWSEDDLDFVRATPNLTYHEVANHLGKRPSTIRGVRQRLSRDEGIRFDIYSDKDPSHVGSRRLLAKTCTKCGLLLEANWFTNRRSGARSWFPACKRCSPSGRVENRSPSAKAAQSRRSQQRLQALSMERAVNDREPYTEADHRVLADPDLTVFEKAIRLGRTYFATGQQCHVNGYTSKVGLGDPMDGRWVIENPNEVAVGQGGNRRG